MFWSDDAIDDFMASHYPWFLPLFESYGHHIQKVDAARYFIVYHFGGVYCDLDISPRTNIEPLLSDEIDVFLVETPNLGLTNSIFGSVPRSDVEAIFLNFFFLVQNGLYSHDEKLVWCPLTF